MFHVVTDLKRISKLNKLMSSKLREYLTQPETRTITSPGGKYAFKVYFQNLEGGEVRGWATGKSTGDKIRNFFVFGEPGADSLVNIAVQINFPSNRYSKALAGVFVEDESGSVYIAHRGKLTGAGGSFKMLRVLDRLPKPITALDNGQLVALALIGGLEDSTLLDDIFGFAKECRDVVGRMALERDKERALNNPVLNLDLDGAEVLESCTNPELEYLLVLSQYFDEYAGESLRRAIGAGVRAVTHGAVVSALELELRTTGLTRKSVAIDLAIISEGQMNLYEVKTSVSTTDMYTGLGQLLIHGEALARMTKLPIRKFLVVPELPRQSHLTVMVDKFDINIVTYAKYRDTYKFK